MSGSFDLSHFVYKKKVGGRGGGGAEVCSVQPPARMHIHVVVDRLSEKGWGGSLFNTTPNDNANACGGRSIVRIYREDGCVSTKCRDPGGGCKLLNACTE